MGFRGVPGHEFVGQTEDGQRVVAEINCSCLVCPVCQKGWPRHCPNRSVLGILGRDGAMADWVSVPRCNLYEVPDSLSDEQAVFVEPLAAAYRISEQVRLGSQRVAILGDGKLGILCAWVARAEGAHATLIGKHAEKLLLAGEGIETKLLEQVQGMRMEYDVVVDATGHPSGLQTALRLVRPLGTVVLKTTMTEPHEVALAPLVIDEVIVVGSRCGPFPPAIAALTAETIDVRPLIQAEYPLVRAAEAFREAGSPGATKILLRP